MKILVISIAGIGDSLISTPLIEELRENFPDATIDLLVLWEQAKKTLENNPNINNILQFNMIKEGHLKSLLFCLKLRKRKYDVSFNTHPQSKIQYRMISKIINAKKRLSHIYDKGPLNRFLVNKTMKQDYNISSIDNNINLLKLINIKPKLEKHQYQIFLSKEDEKKADDFFKDKGIKGKTVGIHVGSGTTKNMILKRWPLKNYINLIQKILKEEKKTNILLFGGPDEEAENRKILKEIQDKRIIIVKTNTIKETAAIIKKCNIFLSVDNVLMHIASAIRVPKQIVIAGPTYDKCVEPKTKPVVITMDFPCQPCYRYDGKGILCTEKEKMKCLKSVSPKIVYEKIKELLKEK